jgi:hypothetical protein
MARCKNYFGHALLVGLTLVFGIALIMHGSLLFTTTWIIYQGT